MIQKYSGRRKYKRGLKTKGGNTQQKHIWDYNVTVINLFKKLKDKIENFDKELETLKKN